MKRIASLGLAALVSSAVAVPAASAAPASSAAGKNVVQVAAGDPQFSTLVSLVKKAGLVSALSGKSKLTVFAPTNAAFAKLPKAHWKRSDATRSEVVKLDGKSVKTLNGKRVRIRVAGRKVYVNTARVTKTDVAASNGVIHVIERVLIP